MQLRRASCRNRSTLARGRISSSGASAFSEGRAVNDVVRAALGEREQPISIDVVEHQRVGILRGRPSLRVPYAMSLCT